MTGEIELLTLVMQPIEKKQNTELKTTIYNAADRRR